MITELDQWIDVCAEHELLADRGVCALVGSEAVAVFRVSPNGALYAVSNTDPFTGASVMSRGIVGSVGDTVKITSPMLKHSFDLHTGRSLDDASVCLHTFMVRMVGGRIEVALAESP